MREAVRVEVTGTGARAVSPEGVVAIVTVGIEALAWRRRVADILTLCDNHSRKYSWKNNKVIALQIAVTSTVTHGLCHSVGVRLEGSVLSTQKIEIFVLYLVSLKTME